MTAVRFELEPGVGAGPLRLGMPRAQARAALADVGFPLESSRSTLDYFADGAIHVEVGPDDTVWFVGFSSHPDLDVEYAGTNLFDVPAGVAFEAVAAREPAATRRPFLRSGVRLDGQVVTFHEADRQYDHRHGQSRPAWSQVGLGDARYLAAMAVFGQ